MKESPLQIGIPAAAVAARTSATARYTTTSSSTPTHP